MAFGGCGVCECLWRGSVRCGGGGGGGAGDVGGGCLGGFAGGCDDVGLFFVLLGDAAHAEGAISERDGGEAVAFGDDGVGVDEGFDEFVGFEALADFGEGGALDAAVTADFMALEAGALVAEDFLAAFDIAAGFAEAMAGVGVGGGAVSYTHSTLPTIRVFEIAVCALAIYT